MLVSGAFGRSVAVSTMHPLLAPILAQLVTLGVGARSEARYTASDVDDRLEATGTGTVGLAFTSPHFSLTAGYAPTLLLSPLESSERRLHFYDTAIGTASAGYGFRLGRATLTLGQSATYTLQNPYLDALAGPIQVPANVAPAPTPEPTAPAPDPGGNGSPGVNPNPATTARRAANYRVQLWSLHSSLGLAYPMTRRSSMTASLDYSLTAGLGRSRRDYPLLQGPGVNLGLSTRVTARDTLTTALNARYAWTEPFVLSGSTLETVNKSSVTTLDETWTHAFNSRTSSALAAGVAYTTNQTNDGPIQHSILPTGRGSLSYATRAGGGMLTVSGGVGVAPVLDLTTGSVDPRLGVGAGAGWVRRRFSLTADVSAAISLDGDEEGAINSVSTNLTAAYDLGAGFSADAGARGAWQTFEDTTIIPPAAAVFIGIGWSAGLPLFGYARGGTPASTTTASDRDATEGNAGSRNTRGDRTPSAEANRR